MTMPRFKAENRDQNVQVASQFQDLAHRKGCTATQLALAWLMKQGDDVIPIPGTRKMKYLEENWKALDVVLTDENEAAIRDFVEKAEIGGGYMPPEYEKNVYKGTAEET